MRKLCLSLRFGVVAGLALAISAGAAHATTIPFGDSSNYWPGFANGTGDDSVDTIGTPNLLGGRLTVSGNLLTRVEIDYTGPMSPVASGPAHVVPGDLFIDANGDGNWDYVLKLVASANTAIANYSAATILDVTGVTPAYLLSGTDNTGYWSGYLIRDNHPYAWDTGGTPIGTGSLDPFNELGSGTYTLGFNLGGGLAIGPNVIIGFAENCANDVIYQPVTVPEPSTALILAAGLLGLARLPRGARRS